MNLEDDDTQADRQRWMRATVADHEVALVRYAARLLNHDVERAREVVQETFLRLWSADREKVQGHVKAWLFTVCRHRAIDVRRREERMQPIPPTQAEAQPSLAPDPQTQAERRESLGRVMAAIEALPERQREVVRLKFQEGLSYKDISRITGHSVSYVGVLLHDGMKALRADLKPNTNTTPHKRRRTTR